MSYTMREMWASSTNYGGQRSTSSIKFIVIHYTANDGDSAQGNGKYFQGANRKASAHYFVDDNTVVHSVPNDRVAWSVGGSKYNNGGGRLYGIAKNANTLNIELCDTNKNGAVKATNATIENALVLTRELMKKYNIPAANVIRHYDCTGKNCPAYWVNNATWENEFHGKLTGTSTSQPAKPTTGATPYRVRKSWADAKSQIGAYSSLENAKAACKSGYSVFDNNGNVVYTNDGTTSTPVAPTPSPKPATSNKIVLTVDGSWGVSTTKRLQQIFNTGVVDGKISNQWKTYAAKNPGLSSTTFEWHDKPNGKGSMLIKKMQAWAGMPASSCDGEIGTNTIKAFQRKLGTSADGVVSKTSSMVKALQRWCNNQ